MKTSVEFQYFFDCPHAKATLGNLHKVVEEGLLDPGDLKVTVVTDIDLAERIHFQGSPTILVNGIDLYSGKTPETLHYTCRLFEIDGVMTGVLNTDFIRTQIDALRDRSH